MIYQAVAVYFVADICWIGISISVGDYVGAIFIAVGMFLGLLAFLKMNSGKMRKTLDN